MGGEPYIGGSTSQEGRHNMWQEDLVAQLGRGKGGREGGRVVEAR